MNTPKPRSRITRRKFAGITLATGVVAGTGLSFFFRPDRGANALTLSAATPLVRNPAFTPQRSNSLILTTRTARGESIAFQLDAQARELWQAIPSAEDHRKGKRATVAQLLDAVSKGKSIEDAGQIRREAEAFLVAALRASILVKPGIKVHIVARARRHA